MRQRERERQRHRQREKQAPCRESYVGTQSQVSRIRPWAKGGAKPLSPPRAAQCEDYCSIIITMIDAFTRTGRGCIGGNSGMAPLVAPG